MIRERVAECGITRRLKMESNGRRDKNPFSSSQSKRKKINLQMEPIKESGDKELEQAHHVEI